MHGMRQLRLLRLTCRAPSTTMNTGHMRYRPADSESPIEVMCGVLPTLSRSGMGAKLQASQGCDTRRYQLQCREVPSVSLKHLYVLPLLQAVELCQARR
jgi:hypothetical protein